MHYADPSHGPLPHDGALHQGYAPPQIGQPPSQSQGLNFICLNISFKINCIVLLIEEQQPETDKKDVE